MVGSAPWASSRAQSWVRPFWAASWSGVNAHLSVALTQVLYLISRAAMSTCYRCGRKGEKTKRRKEIRNKKRTRLIQSLWCLLRAVKNEDYMRFRKRDLLTPSWLPAASSSSSFSLVFQYLLSWCQTQLNLFLCTAGSPDSLTGVDHPIYIHTCFVTIEAPECFQGKWKRQKNYIKLH